MENSCTWQQTTVLTFFRGQRSTEADNLIWRVFNNLFVLPSFAHRPKLLPKTHSLTSMKRGSVLRVSSHWDDKISNNGEVTERSMKNELHVCVKENLIWRDSNIFIVTCLFALLQMNAWGQLQQLRPVPTTTSCTFQSVHCSLCFWNVLTTCRLHL